MVASSVASSVLGSLRAWKRAQSASAIALELGFNYTPWVGPESLPRLDTALFQRASGGSIKNMMTGTYAGLGTQLFDYSYVSGSAQNARPVGQTVVVYAGSAELPAFEMEPEGLGEKFIDAIRHTDIDFDSHPRFSRMYALRGPQEAGIRAFFNDGLLSFLEGLNTNKRWHIEGAGKTLVIYRYGYKVSPGALKSFLEETAAIAQSFGQLTRAAKAF